jgi:hypothetical protein
MTTKPKGYLSVAGMAIVHKTVWISRTLYPEPHTSKLKFITYKLNNKNQPKTKENND